MVLPVAVRSVRGRPGVGGEPDGFRWHFKEPIHHYAIEPPAAAFDAAFSSR